MRKEATLCGGCLKPWGDGSAHLMGKCIAELRRQHLEALKLLGRCVQAIRKAKNDYLMGWDKAIEQRPLSDAADDAASFLLTTKDHAGTIS